MLEYSRSNHGPAHVALVLAMLASGVPGKCRAVTSQVPTAEPPSAPVTAPASINVQYWTAHPPAYPAMAVERHEQGMVVLNIRVSAGGQPTQIVIDEKATHATGSLVSAAAIAARHWRYNPRVEHGKAVPGWVLVPVVFRLPPRTGLPAPPHVHTGS